MRKRLLVATTCGLLALSGGTAFADPDFGPGNSSKGPNDGGAKCHDLGSRSPAAANYGVSARTFWPQVRGSDTDVRPGEREDALPASKLRRQRATPDLLERSGTQKEE